MQDGNQFVCKSMKLKASAVTGTCNSSGRLARVHRGAMAGSAVPFDDTVG